ncbi:3-deoxy-7-phosphoheptulonate synthase [Pseudomonas fluorescens]|uniref:Phospho-2-dehydro-3-deoxyheptonate aldolase n=1 Tax=Pseudomonas fluorescens TaxID=294 RepID=A0A944DEF6_PSEFL|nr:3-deoxy-7-phosphoheptulonate synthase [Pseudomonas fluorescens]MBT2298241.1 3-deoxy-7-phosphoheptulonate synthase [Pseudomonas fluorescens]MBT2309636.1 3-deoxy-7-phosphoheptulonate synthase [Pseudomonas fluorescens]MBT2314800.1 3-deoxy-7-phosphoheptulonate synthase [Pseudomonas fluorescens]MBT2327706.1 3-deoxy-7-phosphoheptulonate synthase [Pseudomonas fluorescens]MBT2345453.1 3-deoxy-7-phosphoheptulonate synthase [Pseudomonas fluorescens]
MNSSVSALPLSTLNPANEALTLRLPSSLQLKQQLPLSSALSQQVNAHRQAIRAILNGEDSRLLVIVGPCSIHDPKSALEYAANLARLAHEVSDSMLLVMRAYVEKPRTTVGWKGLAYDPGLDGSDDMAAGLTLSRELMREMLQLGLPVATELLQPMAANYFDDLLSWVAIGARTTESQIHREMASGLGMPVGFKNGTDGGVGIACDAMRSAAHPHRHFGVDSQGHPAIIQTQGNPDTHLVLRGGHHGPNYDRQSVTQIHHDLTRLKIPARIMVDCSHANSSKDPLRQPQVFNDVLEQRLQGNRSLIGMMLESHLFEGCQSLSPSLRYGVSVTDGCLGWASTEQLLRQAHHQLLA